MPTYEYKCDACGHGFEKFQSITAEPIKKCPKCGKNRVKRLIGTGAGLIFKGGGFYITDYRDASYKEKAKADNGVGDKGAGGDKKPAAADAKPDTAKPAASAASSGSTDSAPAAPAKPEAAAKAAKKSKSR